MIVSCFCHKESEIDNAAESAEIRHISETEREAERERRGQGLERGLAATMEYNLHKKTAA